MGWTNNNTGNCRLARIDDSGTITAGPIDVKPNGVTTCGEVRLGRFANGDYAYVVHDLARGRAYGGTIAADFATVGTPTPLGGNESFVTHVTELGDRVRIPIADAGTVNILDMAQDGSVTPIGDAFGSMAIHPTIHDVGGASFLIRAESGVIRIRKLCR